MPINPNYSGVVQSLDITEVNGLTTSLDEIDASLENLQIGLETEITNREDADIALQTNINEKLDEANSIYNENYSFYCVDGKNDLHSILPNITNQASVISVSSGTFGNTEPLIINKNNLAIHSVPSSPPICEFNALLTIPSTAFRIRFNYLSFDNVCVLNGRNCVFSNSTFNNDVFIGEGMNTYQTYNNCEFSSGKTITFSNQLAGALFFINCNMSSANLVFNNLSPLLVIFSNCSGFVSLPTSVQATLVGLNVLADGSKVQNNISKIVLPIGSGEIGQVLTSGGTDGADSWTTPTEETNIVKKDADNTLTGINTFQGETIFNGDISGVNISDIENLQNVLNEKLAEANSVHFPNYSKYLVDNRDDFQTVINSITNQGSVVNISQGSFGGSTAVIINKQNIALIAPASTPAIVEFGMPVETASTADRIRMRYLSFDNVCNFNASRSVYNHTTFNDNLNIGASSTAGYMSYVNCEFASGKTITIANNFGSVIFFINCNFSSANLVLNQASAQQVIFSNCSGYVAYPTNATLIGLNVLASGYSQNNITKTVLGAGSGEIGQVLTSGGAGGADTWTTPESGGGGGGGGVNLETIMVQPQGQTLTTKSGNNLTLQNAFEPISLEILGGFTVLTGSEISYQPPAGTKLVIISYSVKMGYLANQDQDFQFSARYGIAGNTSPFNKIDLTYTQAYYRTQANEITVSIPINIDPSRATDDIANGNLKTWDVPKFFYIIGSRQTETPSIFVYHKRLFNGVFEQTFAPPLLKIEAFS